MNSDRWQAVNALFHAALEVDGPEREALLRTRAEADPELVEEVRSLLARHQPGAKFLEAPAWAVAASLMADDAPSLVGKKVGSYQILEEIGRGGMGVVYAARDERLGRTVALKALPPEYTRDRRHRDRLAREARAAAAFTHESIATVFALEEIDGELYIASELVEGDTLRAELARGPVASDRLIATLVDIASGLSAAHRRNIIHRDLKPENLIRRTDGHIKILDFGLARITDPDNRTVTRLTEDGTAPGNTGLHGARAAERWRRRRPHRPLRVRRRRLGARDRRAPFWIESRRHARAHDGGPPSHACPASCRSRRSTRSSGAACAYHPPTATRRPTNCSPISRS